MVLTPEPAAQLVSATSLGLWFRLWTSKSVMMRSRKASQKGDRGEKLKC